jgi:hypothetical protein
VIVSTHSDYFVRELNTLLMLKKDFSSKNSIMKKYAYEESMLLNSKEVNAYVFCKNTITKMEIDEEEGIIAKTFDDIIYDLNAVSDEIYYTKQSDLEDETAS